MTPEEKAEQVRLELAKQLERPTQEAFAFIQKNYTPVAEESNASEILSIDEIEKLLQRNNFEIYAPRLGELMEEAGFIRKMVIRKNTMSMAWLLLRKKEELRREN